MMIIIPDIHGRTFWKDAIKEHKNDDIIFLGDYVDPYVSLESILPWTGLTALQDVIAFKKAHPDNVTLLLGNHDLSYISQRMPRCRHDYENHDEIRRLFMSNLSLFQIAHEKTVGNVNYLFTHAGILPDWLKQNEFHIGRIKPGHEVEKLNELFHEGKLYQALSDISMYRGGYCEAGSCVWADIEEHIDYELRNDAIFYLNVYQVFGHTLQQSEVPIVTNHFACLDCRHAFQLTEEGQFIKL